MLTIQLTAFFHLINSSPLYPSLSFCSAETIVPTIASLQPTSQNHKETSEFGCLVSDYGPHHPCSGGIFRVYSSLTNLSTVSAHSWFGYRLGVGWVRVTVFVMGKKKLSKGMEQFLAPVEKHHCCLALGQSVVSYWYEPPPPSGHSLSDTSVIRPLANYHVPSSNNQRNHRSPGS